MSYSASSQGMFSASAVRHLTVSPSASAFCRPIARSSGLRSVAETVAPRRAAGSAEVPVPAATRPGSTSDPDAPDAPDPLRDCLALVREQAAELVRAAPHLSLVEVPTEGLLAVLQDAPVRLSTMGRGLDEDPAAFLAAAAAGVHARELLG